MPRLNVYLSNEAYELASGWRDTVNLSDICSRAIVAELGAKSEMRYLAPLANHLRSRSQLEREILSRFQLADAVVTPSPAHQNDLREVVGLAAATYLDTLLTGECQIAVCGGRQMWNVVRNLKPRNVSAQIAALGFANYDSEVLHVHPNTLVTLLSLLYSPRSKADVIGQSMTTDFRFTEMPAERAYPTYFVISSCSTLDQSSPFGRLLGSRAAAQLGKNGATADYAYVFLDEKGSEIKPALPSSARRMSSETLRRLSARSDARTLLVAGGEEKVGVIRRVLDARLCNTIVTDEVTGRQLLEGD